MLQERSCRTGVIGVKGLLYARHNYGVAWTGHTSTHEHGCLLRYPPANGHLEVCICKGAYALILLFLLILRFRYGSKYISNFWFRCHLVSMSACEGMRRLVVFAEIVHLSPMTRRDGGFECVVYFSQARSPDI